MKIFILEPFYIIKKSKELSKNQKIFYVFKESIYLLIELDYICIYFMIFISNMAYSDIISISLYGIIFGIILLRKSIKFIMEVIDKNYTYKLSIIKFLSYLCILINVFIVIIMNYNIKLLIIKLGIIILFLWDIKLNINYLKNKDTEKRMEIRKKSIILQIFNLMLGIFFIITAIPYMLIILELLRELKKYIKSEKNKKALMICSIIVMCTILILIYFLFIF